MSGPPEPRSPSPLADSPPGDVVLARQAASEAEHFGSKAKLRVLFLCTRNSARSQIAEALLTYKAERLRTDRYVAGSAGASPATAVHPRALAALRARGIEWGAASPKSIDAVAGTPWDLIITVCDRAKETCPVFPGKPIFAHWGMSDPAEATGDDAAIRRAFDTTLTYLSRRIDLLLALPFESLEQSAFELRVQQIARDVPAP